ncbi:MAG: 6-phosphofructokinase [Acidobacteria bacterium]|nr:6-phosphofructokinase [Acidobacteriota bacterium]
MSKLRVGILTGGGDVSGLNSVINGVTYRAEEAGMEVLGIRRGWKGLTHIETDDPASVADYTVALNRDNTRTIDRFGGTWLHSSRTNPSKMKKLPPHLRIEDYPSRETTKDGVTSTSWDVTAKVLKNLAALKLDYLVAIGGDDTLSYAARLNDENFNVIAVPKTMDNDVRNTEYCIGFSTAISRAMEAVQRQRSTVGSHERLGVFRIFGRDAGYTALYTAYVTSIRCGIPEYKFDLNQMVELLMHDRKRNPSSYALVLLSEGAAWEGYKVQEYGEADDFGHRKKMNVGEVFADKAREISKGTLDPIISDLTYDLRSGAPDFTDKLVATTFGNMAFDAILAKKSGLMTAIVEGQYALMPIPDPKLGPRKVDIEKMYNTERYRPKYDNHLGLPIFLTRA